METPTVIEWPVLAVSNFVDPLTGEQTPRSFTLRYTYASQFLLTKWGVPLGMAPTSLELAAAMAGSFIAPGQWRNEGFARAVDLADMMDESDEAGLMDAVLKALKNRFPRMDFSAQPAAGTEAPKQDESKTTSLEPGPSPEVIPASA